MSTKHTNTQPAETSLLANFSLSFEADRSFREAKKYTQSRIEKPAIKSGS